MTYGAFSPQDVESYDTYDRTPSQGPHAALCAAALVLSSSLGLWIFYNRPVAPTVPSHPVTRLAKADVPKAEIATPTPVFVQPKKPDIKLEAAWFDPTFTWGEAGLTLAQAAPLQSVFEPFKWRGAPTVVAAAAPATPAAPTGSFQTASLEPQDIPVAEAPDPADVVLPLPEVSKFVDAIPLPVPRPTALQPAETALHPSLSRRVAEAVPQQAPAPVTPANAPGFFEKFFGRPNMPGTALGYASPEDSGGITNLVPGRPAGGTAIYDITAHTVYLPDGTRLEAHSGLGPYKDNLSGVSLHMRGATPPNMYALAPREAVFHGVAALRMTPIGNGETYGREGLLTHSYMLRGRPEESNGCVVFKDYAAFLRAYQSGLVRRLLVVERMS